MKRKILYMLLCLCLAFHAIGIGAWAEELPDWDICLSAENVTPTGMTLVISGVGDATGGVVLLNDSFCLEVLTDRGWKPMPYPEKPPFFPDMPEFSLVEPIRKEIDWSSLYGQLPVGTYRFAKFMVVCPENAPSKQRICYAEFHVEDTHPCSSGDGDARCDECRRVLEHECRYLNGSSPCDLCGEGKIPPVEQVPEWGISLAAENVIPTGMTLVLTQVGGSDQVELEYDTCYDLQVFEDGKWQWVPDLRNGVCSLMTDQVRPNYTSRLEIDWEPFYGELFPGRYRLVREFIRSSEEGDEDDWFYAEFIVTDQHTCSSGDDEGRCDACLGLTEHQSRDANRDGRCDLCGTWDEYRVVGNADWLGSWDPAFEAGRMIRQEGGTYKIVFQDVLPGNYEIKVTKNGTWEESWGYRGDNFSFTVAEQTDVIVVFALREGGDPIRVWAPATFDEEEEEGDRSADTGDASLLPVFLLLTALPAACLLLSGKRKYE